MPALVYTYLRLPVHVPSSPLAPARILTRPKVTDDVDKARAMAEQRVAIRPEPGLLCLLAEMTQV